MKNFTQQIFEHLAHQPEKKIVVFQRIGAEDYPITYRELYLRSKKYADSLKDAGVLPGEVVIIILQHSLELIFAYFGAILHGSIPSIMPFLTEKLLPEKYRSDLISLFHITQPGAVITYAEFQQEIETIRSEGAHLRAILYADTIESLPDYANIDFNHTPAGYQREALDTALLQHSSGSTGLQKGVALSHQAVFNQITNYGKAISLTQEDVIVSWLPLYHDMGLIACFLMPILFGVQLVIMSPFDWVKAPHRLFHAISHYRGTLCWLPNFAYNFCAKKVREADLQQIELSSLRAVINCSEPMRYESHQMFYERFAAYGLREEALATCYAMAENVFAVTQDGIDKPVTYDRIDLEKYQHKQYAQPAVDGRQSIIMVSAGKPLERTHVRIIDSKGNFLEERFLGEIVLKSDCMLSGYYNREEETSKSFLDGWFKTGDLGYMANGELYISGRKKDLIIVGGKNIYPQDIESLVSNVKGVHPGRVVTFGVFNEDKGTEDVVVIAESEDQNPAKQKELAQEIRQIVTKSTAVALHSVYLVGEKWLIKTSSGKIARAANKEKYLKETAG